jgi:integrase
MDNQTNRTRTATSTPGIRKVTTKTEGKQPVVTYEARIRTDTGREVQKSFPRLEDARAFRSEVLHQRSTGTLTDARLQKVTFAHWVNGAVWRKHLSTLRPKTLLIYTRATDRAVKHFGETPLPKISTATIEAFRDDTLKVLNAGGTNQAIRVVRTCLAHAEKAQLIQRNSASNIRATEDVRPEDRPERRALTEDEAARLLAEIPAKWHALVATSLTLGLRWSELAGLQRKHVDLEAGEIRIERQAYWLNSQLIVSAPKTKAGTRRLPIPDDLAGLLANHLAEYAQPGDEGIVFPSNSGRVIDNSIFRQGIWKPAIERAGIRHVVIHGLRVTSTTWLLDAGINAKTVSVMQGHSSPAVTMAVYARSSAASQKLAADKVGEALGRVLILPKNVVSITKKAASQKGVAWGANGADAQTEAVS